MSDFSVFIGGSAGSIAPLISILSRLPANFSPSITLVIHSNEDSKSTVTDVIANNCPLTVIEISDKGHFKSNTVHVAPGGYHLYVENKKHFSLSIDKKIHFSRPSIDVLFTSAAEVFKNHCIAILLSGANGDGAEGLLNIKKHGGLTIAQSPASAQVDIMPQTAIDKGAAAKVLSPKEISHLLLRINDEYSLL